MGVWSGLGLNYKSFDPTNNAWDAQYFKGIGLNKLRIDIPGYLASKSTLDKEKATAKFFHDQGFYVIYGLTCGGGPMNSTTWNDFATKQLSYVLECVGCCDEYQVGNEEELHNDNTTLTDTQVRANVRALATQLKALAPSLKFSYSTEQNASSTSGSRAWTLEGKGDLDLIGLNTYAGAVKSGAVVTSVNQNNGFKTRVQEFSSTFKSNEWYVSEWNLEAGSANYNAIPEELRMIEQQKMYQFIKANCPSAYLYQYCAYNDNDAGDSFWLMKGDRASSPIGNFRPAWEVLLNDWDRPKRRAFVYD